jgi:glucose-1-phosphate thymidylyltransferase
MKVACLEEIAFRKGWLREQLQEQANKMAKNEYGRYLRMLINEEL